MTFFVISLFQEFFFLKFDSTLTADNSGSKPLNLEKYHIIRIVRTSSISRTHVMGWSETLSYVGWLRCSKREEGQILKKKKVREMANCDCDLHLTPDEKDVQVDGGEDKEGNGYEEEKDVPR